MKEREFKNVEGSSRRCIRDASLDIPDKQNSCHPLSAMAILVYMGG